MTATTDAGHHIWDASRGRVVAPVACVPAPAAQPTIDTMAPITRPRRGFTIVELLIIIVVLAILATIAYGAITRAQGDNEVEQARITLNSVVADQLTFASQYGTFTAWPDDIATTDGADLTNAASTAHHSVSLALSADGNLGLATAAGNRCLITTLANPLTNDGPGEVTLTPPNTACTGASALSGHTLTTPTSKATP